MDFLKDLIVMRDMILEQARWQYKERNPGSPIPPSEFSEIDLKLVGIGGGIAKPILKLATPRPTMNDILPHQEIFEEARDRMVGIIGSVKHDMHQHSYKVSPKALSLLSQLGKSLLDEESIEFSIPALQTPVELTGKIHRQLAKIVSQAAPVREATLRGRIHKMDQKNETFTMQQIHGPQIKGSLPKIDRKQFFDAFNGYKADTTIEIECTVPDGPGPVTQIQSITKVRLLDRLNVPAQLDEIRSVKNGWLDGCGTAPSHNGLDWLSETFSRYYPHNATLPYVCPTPEGGISMEWSVGKREIGLEIDVEKHSGEWSWDDISTGASDEKFLDLDKHDNWEWVANQIQSMTKMSK